MFCLRPRSSLALVFALIYAMVVATLSPQVARAAEQVLYVNTADDPYPAPGGTCSYLAQQSDKCSLRSAILKANAAAGGDTITIKFQVPRNTTGYMSEFPIPGLKVETWTIKLSQSLDFITHDGVTIDGFSQAQYIGGNPNVFGPEIIIDGSNVPATGGLTFQSSNNTVRGLGIVNFQATAGLAGIGIEFRSTSSNSGSSNVVQGCYIGINRLGTAPAPNTIGIWVRTSSNTIGGNSTTTDQPNVISGNINDGVLIEGDDNKVQGNLIGLNASGDIAVPNQGNGVTVRISSNNLIGSPSTATDARNRNVISGNTQQGVLIFNGQNNQIAGNLVGTDVTGAEAIPNRQNGVYVYSSGGSTSNNKIGDTSFFSRNVISGNGTAGVRIQGDRTTDNLVFNNMIGLSSGGTRLTGTYTQTGVIVEGGADRNQIGGGDVGQSNTIAGNKGDGVRIAGFTDNSIILRSEDNIVSGNIIGTQAISNTGAGIVIDTYTNRTRIGGNGTNEGNRVVNNAGDGIRVTGAKPTSTMISGNTIRTNGGNGVTIVDGTNVMTTTLSNNSINLNVGDGVQISGANNTLIFSNTIGMGKGDALGNGVEGIRMTNSVSATVQANKVIGNSADGVRMASVTTGRLTGNTVNQNRGKGFNIINGSTAISITSNTVYSNTEEGVFIGAQSLSAQKVQVTDNSISANGGLGINLEPQTDGLPGVATNPNHDIDAPFGIRINQDGLLTGRVYATTGQNASCIGCTVQIFGTNPELRDGQGKTKIAAPVEISSNGYFTATIGSVPGQLALTATDSKGNTSEFGVFDAIFGLAIGPARAGTAAPGDTITYTHRITNTGTVDFTDLQLSATSSKGWPAKVVPPAPIALAMGQSRPVTVTLTLPKAPNSTVLAGTVDLTRVTVRSSEIVTATASVTDTTTVASAFKLEVSPAARSGSGVPEQRVNYTHTLRNSGNLTGTVVLSASTNLGWTTSITPTQITLGPGEQRDIVVSVTVPQDARAGTTAKTTVGIQVVSPAGQPPVVVTDTTTVATQPLGTIVPDRAASGYAGQTFPFQHTVKNLSNGPVTFKLQSSVLLQGTTVTFRGSNLGPNNTLQLAVGQEVVVYADVTLGAQARAGSTELVSINLLDEQGQTISGVQDTIAVTAAPITQPPPTNQTPRAYLPLIQQ